MNWKPLDRPEQLNEIDSQSDSSLHKAVLIFKHSTRCSVSSMALARFDRGWNVPENEIPVYFLDLIAHRPVSNEIASRYGVHHESPQVLLIRNGKCVYHASHMNIDPAIVAESVK